MIVLAVLAGLIVLYVILDVRRRRKGLPRFDVRRPDLPGGNHHIDQANHIRQMQDHNGPSL